MMSTVIKVFFLLSVVRASEGQQDTESVALAKLLKALTPEGAFNLANTGVRPAASHLASAGPCTRGLLEPRMNLEMESKYGITDVEAEIIAKNVREMYDIPFLPNPLERIVVKQAIIALDKAFPLVLDEDVYLTLVADTQDSNKVEEAVVRALSERIDVPLISKELQDDLVDKVCTVMYSSASAKAVKRKMFTRATQHFLNTDDRDALATQLNDMFDIPLVSEDKEQWLARGIVDAAFGILRTILPPQVLDVLQTTSTEELQGVRENMIKSLNEKIDVPWQDEKQEEGAITAIVDFFLKRYGLYDIKVLSEEEQIKALQFKLDCVEVELEAQRSWAQEKEEALLASKKSYEEKLAAMDEAEPAKEEEPKEEK